GRDPHPGRPSESSLVDTALSRFASSRSSTRRAIGTPVTCINGPARLNEEQSVVAGLQRCAALSIDLTQRARVHCIRHWSLCPLVMISAHEYSKLVAVRAKPLGC